MAKSAESIKPANNTEDDFQDMLEDTEPTAFEAAETIDDEDAIDRLLMDNAFEKPGDDDKFAEIDELVNGSLAEPANDKTSDVDDEFDEFAADDEPEQPLTDDSANHSEAIDTAESETEHKQQKTDDMTDEISADIEADKSGADDDLFMTDLDISADDEEDVLDDEDDESQVIMALPDEAERQEDEKPQQQALQASGFSTELASISAQLSLLQNEQEQFKTRLTADNSQFSAFVDELEGHNNEQKKLQRRLTLVEKKLPTALVYSGLGIAVIALITAVGLLILSFGTDSRTTELSAAIVDLDDKVNAWLNNSSNKDQLNNLSSRHEQLSQTVENNSAQLSEIDNKLEELANLNKDDTTRNQINQLSEGQLQTAAVVESLQRKIEVLEKSKRAASNLPRKKDVVVREKWVVNLVAFRQEWYAKRKALEYEKKGVPAVVKAVVVKGENWYRLLVKGFGKKFDAAAYASKVKKNLNLTSVWVARE